MEPSLTFHTVDPEHPTVTYTARPQESKEEFFARCKTDLLRYQQQASAHEIQSKAELPSETTTTPH